MTKVPEPLGARLLGLDALRGLCAFAVLVFHLTTDYGNKFGWPTGEPAVFMPWASFAVRTFFVLSGFVIYFSLENARNSQDFAVARFARLYPAYVCACAFTLFVILAGDYNPRNVKLTDIPANLTMLATLLGFNHIDAPYWTLQREVCFYALMALLFSLRRLVSLEALLVAWLMACMAANVMIAGPSFYEISSFVDRLAVLFGFQVAHLFVIGIVAYQFMMSKWSWKTVAVTSVALIASGFSEWPRVPHFDLPTVAKTAGYGLLILAAARIRFPSSNLFAPLLWLGRISYAVYLVHETFGYFVISFCQGMGLRGTACVCISVVCCLAVGHLMNVFVEAPARRWVLDWHRNRLRLGYAKAGRPST